MKMEIELTHTYTHTHTLARVRGYKYVSLKCVFVLISNIHSKVNSVISVCVRMVVLSTSIYPTEHAELHVMPWGVGSTPEAAHIGLHTHELYIAHNSHGRPPHSYHFGISKLFTLWLKSMRFNFQAYMQGSIMFCDDVYANKRCYI